MGKVEKFSVKEGNLNKAFHKLVLYSVKMIPVVISGIYILNTVLSYFYIDLPLLSYIVQYLFIAFMYIGSYAFKFCSWHRLFIHYITLILTINIIDYHFQLPLTDRGILLLYGILTGVFIFVGIYLRFKVYKHCNKS